MVRLTQKQETFCLKYFELGNPGEAAIVAGYSPKTASVIASENLTKPKIINRLQKLQQVAEDVSVANVLERKQVLSEIVRARFGDFWKGLNDENLQSAALQEITRNEIGDAIISTKVKLHSPIHAIAELNKMEKVYLSDTTLNILNVNVDARDMTDEQLAIIAGKDNTSRRSPGASQEAPSS